MTFFLLFALYIVVRLVMELGSKDSYLEEIQGRAGLTSKSGSDESYIP